MFSRFLLGLIFSESFLPFILEFLFARNWLAVIVFGRMMMLKAPLFLPLTISTCLPNTLSIALYMSVCVRQSWFRIV